MKRGVESGNKSLFVYFYIMYQSLEMYVEDLDLTFATEM